MSDLLVIATVLTIGGLFWSQKALWAKGVGLAAFVTAILQTLSSPVLMTLVSLLIAGIVVLRFLMARRKRHKKEHEGQIHIHNYR